jgi:hypothetical protein
MMNPYKVAFFGLLGLNVVGILKHHAMMRRKAEWCAHHPEKCKKWRKMHGVDKKGRGGPRNAIAEYFWPRPPMWMRHHHHHGGDDDDWFSTVKFEGETFPPEELGSENEGLEGFKVPENWACRKRRGGGKKDDSDSDRDRDSDNDRDSDDRDRDHRGRKRRGGGQHERGGHHRPRDENDENDDKPLETVVNDAALAAARAAETVGGQN